MEQPEKKKRTGIRLVSRKSTKKMLGRWTKLDSVDKSDSEAHKTNETVDRRVMGRPLMTALEMEPSLDGIPLPAFFRISIDYIEANSLKLEGIYRVSSPKSRLDELERRVNNGSPFTFNDGHEAAGLVKRFLRQLPEPLLPPELELLADKCCCDWKSFCKCGISEEIKTRLGSVDRAHYFLVAYTFLHAQRVISHEADNKMGVPALGLLFQTVMEMSRKLVCMMINNASRLLCESDQKMCPLFDNARIVPYVPPRSPAEVESWSCEDKPLIEEELNKQINLLAHLHTKVSNGDERAEGSSGGENQLWSVQMAITSLKRRLKAVAEPTSARECETSDVAPCAAIYEEKQLMAVQSMLRDDIGEEHRRIGRLLWKLEKKMGLSETKPPLDASDACVDWREECSREEKLRLSLLDQVDQLRSHCAVLRANIEILSQPQLIQTRF